MARAKKPKVEFLYDLSFSGDRFKGCDVADEMMAVVDVVKEHPDANYAYINDVDCDGWNVDFLVVFRKLAKRVTDDRIEEEFRAMIKARFEEEDEEPEGEALEQVKAIVKKLKS